MRYGRLGALAGAALAALLLAGCGAVESPEASKAMGGGQIADNSAVAAKSPAAPAVSTDASAVSRKIIYTATVDLVAERLSTAETALLQLVKAHRGYVAENEVTGSPGSPRQGHWKVRVPVEEFQGFMAAAAKLGELQKIHTDSQDVSEEYYDVNARISNKQVEEQRLLTHLRNSTARLQDVLSVERELSRVRGEVEQLQGRLRYLSNHADLSTVTVTISEVKEYLPVERTTFTAQIGRTFHESVRTMGDAFGILILAAVALAPWLAVLAIPAACIWLMMRRRGPNPRPDAGP